jgi:hypothetical protein
MGIERSDDLIILQITVSNTRSVEQKKALFARWSFGNGIAQYAH